MSGGIHQNLIVVIMMPLLGQNLLIAAVAALVGAEILRCAEVNAAAGQVGADAGIRYMPGVSAHRQL